VDRPNVPTRIYEYPLSEIIFSFYLTI